jgi:Zn-dependent protease
MALRTSLKIGRLRGVDLKLHVSLLFILVYIVLIASAQLPFVLEALGLERADVGLRPWVWGAIFAVGLFASVLLHELGHVVVAQKQGGKVRGITLWMLGGASEIEHIPDKKYAELKLAFVGPLVSFALAIGLYLISTAPVHAGIVLITRWLASVNLILAIFNLLPAFPMDGGRMLRSWLAGRMGKLRGTRAAVRVSQGLSLMFGLLGLLSFNILLLLIAMFVYMAARAELAVVTSQEMLRGVRARDMVTRTSMLEEWQPVGEAVRRMQDERSPVLPVRVKEGHGIAVVTIDRLRRVPQERWGEVTVGSVAERVARVLRADEPVADAFQELAAAPGQALPVGEIGYVVGVLRLADLAQAAELHSLGERQGSFAQARH